MEGLWEGTAFLYVRKQEKRRKKKDLKSSNHFRFNWRKKGKEGKIRGLHVKAQGRIRRRKGNQSRESYIDVLVKEEKSNRKRPWEATEGWD